MQVSCQCRDDWEGVTLGIYWLQQEAEWRGYDGALGRFTQADTIVPGGAQGLDRYAYTNNAPINYVDPSGHFTEDAIVGYIGTQCAASTGYDSETGEGSQAYSNCVSSTLATWQADTDWWNMMLDAMAGDVLFGTADGEGTFTATFTGEGKTLLTGVDFHTTIIGVSPTNTTLFSIQSGSTIRTGARASHFYVELTWMGFFRPEEHTTPRFWHFRSGYEKTEGEAPGQIKESLEFFIGAVLGLPCSGSGFGYFACSGAGVTATNLIVDGLDMEYGDYYFIVGPLYFNFNGNLVGGNSYYSLEHILFNADGWK